MNTQNAIAAVTVIGAGPAGIVTALELAKNGIRVNLVESGKRKYDETIQQLAECDEIDLKRHAPMGLCTRRQIGGASVTWGGRCLPFDPVDFDERPHIPNSDWPVKYEDVKPYFASACEYFFCGEPAFNTNDIEEISQKTIVPGLKDGTVLSSSLERWSLPTNFGKEYRKALLEHPNIRLISGFNCTRFKLDDSGHRISGVVLRSLEGEEQHIESDYYVLACGGLETTRLLMAANAEHQTKAFGDLGGKLGKFYMGHISGGLGKIVFHTDPKKTVYGYLRDKAGIYLRPKFTFSREFQHQEKLANVSFGLVSPALRNPEHRNGVLSFAFLALVSPLGKYFAPAAIRKAAIEGDSKKHIFKHIWNMLADLPRTLVFIPTFGVRRFLLWRRVPGFHQFMAKNVYPLHYHGEQIPHEESCVTLSDKTNSLGVPKLNIDLQFHESDIENIVRAHQFLDQYLRDSKIGEIVYDDPDLAQRVADQAADGYHQAGTTRMSDSEQDGVVNADCKVHGMDNLFIASSSIFVTSGQANSTFMIVVFALRMVEHLKKLLGSNAQ